MKVKTKIDLEGDGQREVECEGGALYSEHLLTWEHPPMTQDLTSRQGHLISCWPGSCWLDMKITYNK